MGEWLETRWSAALFDLDGTLLDTRPGVRAAAQAALAETSHGAVRLDEPDWGQPLAGLLAQMMPGADQNELQRALASFRRHYDGGLWAQASPFDGAAEVLASLNAAGMRLFVVTNKRRTSAELLLAHFGMTAHLDAVEAQDDSGEAVAKFVLARRCLEHAGIPAAMAVAVGDSDHDEAMAEALGVTFVAVTSGTGPLSGGGMHHRRVEVVSLADAASYLLHTTRGGTS